ncbi:MAG: ABC transporter ATP-binding protein [Candidatus Poribacteria bacterium]|nr:ABC transporter ATP-binding protein [Candidatus Poribacteria bacterium]
MESTNVFRRLIAIFWVLGIVLRRHFFLATSMIFTALILSLEPVASLYIFSKVVDRSVDYVQGTATLSEVGLVFALQGGLFAVQRIITPLKDWLGGVLSNHLLNDITMDLMEKTSKLPYILLESKEIYNNLEMANGTKDRIPQIFTATIGLGSNLVMFGSMFWLLSQLSPWLAVAVVAIMLPYILLDQHIIKQSWELTERLSILRRKMAFLSGTWSGRTTCRELRIWNAMDWIFEKYSQVFRTWFTAERRQRLKRMIYQITGGLCMAAGFVLVLFMTLQSIEAGTVTVGKIAMYIQAVNNTQGAAYQVFVGISSLFEHGLYVLSIQKVLKMEVPVEKSETSAAQMPNLLMNGKLPTITFQGVSFKYPGSDAFAVKDINLKLQLGKMTALVGENAAGKSTIAKMAIGLYPPTEGQILINGVPLSSANTSEWFKHTKVLFQDSSQYALTLAENVLLGQGSDRDVVQVLDEAGFAPSAKIDANTLTEILSKEFGGTELSGGQWKKVGLARALAKQGSFFMLDEPSAALDPRAEYELFMKLKEMMSGVTTLFVTHRLAATINADWIIVLDDGKITEQGQHEQLMKSDGLYAQLFNLQASLMQEATWA